MGVGGTDAVRRPLMILVVGIVHALVFSTAFAQTPPVEPEQPVTPPPDQPPPAPQPQPDPTPDPVLPPKDDSTTPIPKTASGIRRNFAGSIQLDYMAIPTEKTGRRIAFDGATTEISLKVAVDFNSRISSNVKMCVACHGFEVGMAFFD